MLFSSYSDNSAKSLTLKRTEPTLGETIACHTMKSWQRLDRRRFHKIDVRNLRAEEWRWKILNFSWEFNEYCAQTRQSLSTSSLMWDQPQQPWSRRTRFKNSFIQCRSYYPSSQLLRFLLPDPIVVSGISDNTSSG